MLSDEIEDMDVHGEVSPLSPKQHNFSVDAARLQLKVHISGKLFERIVDDSLVYEFLIELRYCIFSI